MGLFLLFVFIGVPLIEIMLFIKIGGAIGMTMTVLIVIITALIGSYMLRAQGLATMRQAQASMDQAELPVEPVIHGIFLLLAGAFLLTPGFLTDTIGFALFVPSFGWRWGGGSSRRSWPAAPCTFMRHGRAGKVGPKADREADPKADGAADRVPRSKVKPLKSMKTRPEACCDQGRGQGYSPARLAAQACVENLSVLAACLE